jgi:enamine deaminase RidA (YjgF/YER057c/UK114 family)
MILHGQQLQWPSDASSGDVTMSFHAPSKQAVASGPAPSAPYSRAVKAGGLIYVSGTLAEDDSGVIADGVEVGAQTQRVIERMRDALIAAGSSLEQAVSVTVFLKSQGDFAAMNDAYRSFWPTDPPARTTVVTDLVGPDALVEMSMIAVPAGAERRVIHPGGWIKSPSPYSYAIQTGDTLFLSGLVSRNGRDNSVVPGDVATQTRTVLENAGELLKAAGMTHANVVSAKIYLPDLATFQQMNAAYRTIFASAPPARATVGAGLAGAQYNVEITMVASSAQRRVIDDGRPANPNLSAAILAGNRVYVSGMLGNTEATKADTGAQTRETLARIRGALEAAGSSPADVVEAVVYLTELDNYAPMNDAYRAFFERDFPARTTIRSGLVAPEGLVEIMAVAERSEGRR